MPRQPDRRTTDVLTLCIQPRLPNPRTDRGFQRSRRFRLRRPFDRRSRLAVSCRALLFDAGETSVSGPFLSSRHPRFVGTACHPSRDESEICLFPASESNGVFVCANGCISRNTPISPSLRPRKPRRVFRARFPQLSLTSSHHRRGAASLVSVRSNYSHLGSISDRVRVDRRVEFFSGLERPIIEGRTRSS